MHLSQDDTNDDFDKVQKHSSESVEMTELSAKCIQEKCESKRINKQNEIKNELLDLIKMIMFDFDRKWWKESWRTNETIDDLFNQKLITTIN